MKTSLIGRNVLITREGLKTVAYRDSVGVLTIGVGHTSAAGAPKVTPGLKITVKEAERIFAQDLVKYENAVNSAIKGDLTQFEFDALVSLCYNIGPGAFAKSTLVKRINAGQTGDALYDAFMMWKKPAEIISRRQAEATQFETPYETAMPKARSTDRARVSDKKRHVAQNEPVALAPVGVISVPIGDVPDPAAEPVEAAQVDPALIAPAKPFPGFLSLLQGKPPVPKGERHAVVAAAKEEAPSLMKDLGVVRTLGIFGGAGSLLGGMQDTGFLDSVKATADGATSTFESVQTLVNLILNSIKWGVAHWWVFGLILSFYVLARIGWAIFKVYVQVKNGLKS